MRLGKQAKRKSLRPDRFKKKKNDRRSSSSQKAATTSTEIGQAIGTVTDDQLTRTRTEASRAMGTLISTATRTESGQPSDAVQDGQSTIDSTMTDQATDKVIADQIIAILTEAGQSTDTVRDENTTAETSQTIDATKDEVLTNGVLEAQSKTSGVKSASTSTNLAATDNDAPDELSRTANTSLVDVERGEDQTEVPHESAPDETSDTNCLESETSSNDAETKAISETTPEQIEGPGRSTRPTPRFSDDTNMLKDFLNRVQAKKAAQKDQSDTVHAHMTDSRLSPRAALADVTLSPPQPSDFPNPRETPAGKQKPRAADCDEKEEAEEEEEEVEEEGDPDELAVQMRSCRRSPRTRLFTPAKLAAITRIPVRRADGTEPIVLRRSEAQELATVTRTNTRKNKGQAKPPKLTLKRLPAENADEMMVTAAKEDEARAVGWDKTLVYYMDQSEAQEGEEKRPRVRRLRKLGAVNGTPAPKKLLAEMYSSNEGSAPKRRSKSKGRVGK